MGKTKTVIVSGDSAVEKGGKAAYEEKKRKQLEAQKKAEVEKAKVAGLGLKGGERIKVIGGETIPEQESVSVEEHEEKKDKKAHKAKIRSEKYKKARAQIDKAKLYSPEEAIKLIKETSYSKFDGTMELHIVVKKENFSIRATLPHSYGKAKKVEIASETTVENLKKGKINFDILLATADMMPKLVAFAKLLGPRGLMPNPKNGTLIKSEKDADKFSGNNLNLKTEKSQPVIHTVIGKVSQNDTELKENIEAVLTAISKKQILKAYLKSTMSPSVKLNIT